MLSTLTMFTMIGTPIVGLFSDKVGRRATIMLLGTLLLIPVFLLMAYTNVSLYVPMAMLGFAFTWCRPSSGRRSLTWSPAHPGHGARRDDHDSESRHDGNE